jgi:hypothetical protein
MSEFLSVIGSIQLCATSFYGNSASGGSVVQGESKPQVGNAVSQVAVVALSLNSSSGDNFTI